jgi:hypothetical protein
MEKKLWNILDKEFEQQPYEKADRVLKRYDTFRRNAGMSMNDYIKDLKRAKRDVELEDPGTTFSAVSFAQKLLRRSGLRREEQRQVLASAGAIWGEEKIEAALRLLYHDARFEDARSRPFLKEGQKGKGGGKSEHRTFPAKPGNKGKFKGHGKGKSKSAFASDVFADEGLDDEDDGEDYSEEDYDEDAGTFAGRSSRSSRGR